MEWFLKFSKFWGAAIDSLANLTDPSNSFFSFIYGIDYYLINFRNFENKTDAPARVRTKNIPIVYECAGFASFDQSSEALVVPYYIQTVIFPIFIMQITVKQIFSFTKVSGMIFKFSKFWRATIDSLANPKDQSNSFVSIYLRYRLSSD